MHAAVAVVQVAKYAITGSTATPSTVVIVTIAVVIVLQDCKQSQTTVMASNIARTFVTASKTNYAETLTNVANMQQDSCKPTNSYLQDLHDDETMPLPQCAWFPAAYDLNAAG